MMGQILEYFSKSRFYLYENPPFRTDLSGSGARIRTWDLRVMSHDPKMHHFDP